MRERPSRSSLEGYRSGGSNNDFDGNLASAGKLRFVRDALGRVTRTERMLLSGPTAEVLPAAQPRSFVYDGQEPIQERDEAGATTNYVRDPGGGLVSRRAGSGAAGYYHHDAIGSVTGLSNGASAMTDTYSYDAFGNVLSKTGTSANAYTYLENRAYTAAGLSDFHARAYDPGAGRFTSEDPIKGLAAMPQTINPYAYGVNGPLAYPDPNGKCIGPLLIVCGAAVAPEVAAAVTAVTAAVAGTTACLVSEPCTDGVGGAISDFQEWSLACVLTLLAVERCGTLRAGA